MQRATIPRSTLARTAVRTPASIVQNCKRNVVARARVETLFLEEGFVAPEFSLPWPEKGFEPVSLMKDVVKVRLGFHQRSSNVHKRSTSLDAFDTGYSI
jgi:hypothetical protein